jgi:hypothetical protein
MEHKEINKKTMKFYCESCDYGCSTQSEWSRHMSRLKHTGNHKEHIEYKCTDCFKIYASQSGLWKHKKVCKEEQDKKEMEVKENEKFNNHLIEELVKQNSELLKQNNALVQQNILVKDKLISLICKNNVDL